MARECVWSDKGACAYKNMHTIPKVPDEAPGQLCNRHLNIWKRENGIERKKKLDRDYTHPDKRDWKWREKQSHKAAHSRHRIQCGCGTEL